MRAIASKTFSTLFTLALLLPGVAAADNKAPGVALVGASLSTGQAIIWDRAAEEYAVVRLGQTYRGATIKRILADRVVLLRGGVLTEVRLSASPFFAGNPRAERRGEPASIIIAGPNVVAPAAAPAPAAKPIPSPVKAPVTARAPAVAARTPIPAKVPVAVKPPAAAKKPPLVEKQPAAAKKPPVAAKPAPAAKKAPAPARAPAPAAVTTAATTAPAAAPARAPAPGNGARKVAVTMPRLRNEVSNFFRRKVSYRGTFSTTGMALSGVTPDSLLFRMGLRNGDRVASLNGWKLVSSDAAMDAYLSLQSGTQVDVIFTRGGKKRVLKLRLV